MRTRASILVGLLWCLALLSIVVIGVLHTSRMDLLVGKNHSDRIQARYLALAGIERAKALLYQDAKQRSRSARNHTGDLYDAPQYFRDVPLGRGQFRVFRRGRQDEGGGIIYGVADEESRLNLNFASSDALSRLYRMTPELVAAIVDWRDGDNAVTPGGAEADYYASLQPNCQPRNGPFLTVRELLMVRGVSRELLLGADTHQNGFLESADDEPSGSGGLASDLNAGWAALLTVDSSVENVNAAGDERVDIQSADETSLTRVHGITSDIAKAIVARRGQNRFESLADLLDVTAAQNQNPGRNPNPAVPTANPGVVTTRSTRGASPSPPSAAPTAAPPAAAPITGPPGPKVITEDLFTDIADDLTVQSDTDLPGLININTASLDVLACLPGVDRDLAQAIISYRRSSGFFPNIAALLKVPGMTRDIFKQLAPRVSPRSETFRILSEGKVNSTGARQRIQVIVHVGLEGISTLSYREDDL